jgi:uncharacterized membrane protein YeaQ/YmgE (transglycosylase-associated protein family)
VNNMSAVGTPTERSRIFRNTGIAAVVTLAINLVLHFVGEAAGWIPDELPERASNYGLISVILYTLLPIIAGGVLLSLLVSWTSHPVIMFSLIAAVVFIASLFAPLSIAGASVSFRSLLVAMHVFTAVVGTFILLQGVYDEPE